MNGLEQFFNLIGSFICHQLPSRTLYAGNIALPVCARDTGIYAGIFTGALFLLLLRRLKAQKIPGIWISVVMCVLMLPMILDGMLSYTGIIGTNNVTRLFTGAFFGLPIPFFLVPAARFSAYGDNTRPVLSNTAELVSVYAVTVVLCFLILKGLVPYAVAGSIFVLGFLFLMSRITFTVLFRIGCFAQKTLYIMTSCTTMCIMLLLYSVSKYLLQPLKAILLGG